MHDEYVDYYRASCVAWLREGDSPTLLESAFSNLLVQAVWESAVHRQRYKRSDTVLH